MFDKDEMNISIVDVVANAGSLVLWEDYQIKADESYVIQVPVVKRFRTLCFKRRRQYCSIKDPVDPSPVIHRAFNGYWGSFS